MMPRDITLTTPRTGSPRVHPPRHGGASSPLQDYAAATGATDLDGLEALYNKAVELSVEGSFALMSFKPNQNHDSGGVMRWFSPTLANGLEHTLFGGAVRGLEGMVFDGTGYLTGPNFVDLTAGDGFSVIAVFEATGTGSQTSIFVADHDVSGDQSWHIGHNPVTQRLQWDLGGGLKQDYSGWPRNTVYSVLMTQFFDDPDDRTQVWKDGPTRTTNQTGYVAKAPTSNDLYIGARKNGLSTTGRFKGTLQAILILPVDLTESAKLEFEEIVRVDICGGVA